jgi:hypothetical protein
MFHGNPKFYPPNDINPVNNKTYGSLYKKTLQREKYIRNCGYNLIVIWEHEFDQP